MIRAFVSIFFISFCLPLLAKDPKFARGQVVVEGALVYDSPSFDGKMIGTLKLGSKFSMSSKTLSGAFYRVQVKKGRFGFVADTDIRPLTKDGKIVPLKQEESQAKKMNSDERGSSGKQQNGERKEDKLNDARSSSEQRVPFALAQFGGLSFLQTEYRETTMGEKPTATTGFYGLKITGADFLVEGLMVTELNLHFSLNPPSFYEKATGLPATGHIMLADFQFVTNYPRGPQFMTFYGFGPLAKWSKYNLKLNHGPGDIRSYRAEDLALGAVFSFGAALRLGAVALRAEARYHWEQMQYFGFGLALQGAF